MNQNSLSYCHIEHYFQSKYILIKNTKQSYRDVMNQNSPYFLFLFLCFSINTFLNAQTQNDSLAKYSYEELHTLIDGTKYDKQELSKIYTSAYLKRAKLDNDKVKISRGYFYLTHYYSELNREKAINYTDSIINICQNCNDKKYPALGYHFKGYLLSLNGDTNRQALSNFLKALELCIKNENVELEIDVRLAIIAIKSSWISDMETVKFMEETLTYVEKQKDFTENFLEQYLITLNNLSVEYGKNGFYEKELSLSAKGIKEVFAYEKEEHYESFLINAGAAQYFLNNYEASIDSLDKALLNRQGNRIIPYYYLGMSYKKLGRKKMAFDYFLRIDSIYKKTKDLYPEIRVVYENIVDYYKSKNDVENQIKYYDYLLEVDYKIDSTYRYIAETFERQYDTPKDVAERNRLLEEAKSSENSWKYSFGIISAVLLAISGVLFYVYRRQKYYKQRFENLMTKSSSKEKSISTALDVTQEKDTSIHSNERANTLDAQKQKAQDIGISETIVKSILKGLTKFEVSKGYRKQVTLTELAKTLETNPKYLSKVINWHYQKNFTSYINELRVHYAILKLKDEAVFRNYTIKAIAQEVGFKSSESFSKTFYKVTGIYPSYFIKQLQKRLED